MWSNDISPIIWIIKFSVDFSHYQLWTLNSLYEVTEIKVFYQIENGIRVSETAWLD